MGDRPLIVGCAKELVEAVAKAVVLAKRGTPGANIKFGSLISQAHQALDRQPGVGLASDVPTRDLAQATKLLATHLGSLRNDLGTGHSRTTLPAVFEESLELAVTASVLWSRWALRRLEALLAGDLEPLIDDLSGGRTFRAGELSRRLVAADLPHLEEEQARRLGRAVGQRAASGTFVVFDDGIGQCAASDDLQTWPVAYREGAALGLLLDREGYLITEPRFGAPIVGLLAVVPDPEMSLQYVVGELTSAPLEPGLHSDPGTRAAIVSAFDEAGRALPVGSGNWQTLRDRFAQPGVAD
jgi:hypothetical protein